MVATSIALLIMLAACSGGGTSSPDNPWSGTRTTVYVLRGDTPYDYQGADASDQLIRAQIKQALYGRTYELDLYEIENVSGKYQSIQLHDSSVLSYLTGALPAYQIPGVLTEANGIARLELVTAGPAFAWQTVAFSTVIDSVRLEAGLARIRPHRHVNPVSSEPFYLTWHVTGLNGSRSIELECKQVCWLYGESDLVP